MTAMILAFILGLSAATLLCWLASRRRDLERRDLHVCPFCGSFLMVRADCLWQETPAFITTGRASWRCVCDNCGALGPVGKSKEEAYRYWGGGWP